MRLHRGLAAVPSSLLAIGLAATLVLSGCASFADTVASDSTPAPSTPVEPKAAPIEWSDCDEQIQPLIADQPGSDRDLAFQCGRTEVPISYDEPKGATLPLFLVKVVMAGQTGRIGSLVVNPGGPGASGADALDGHPWQDWANAQIDADGEHRMPGAVSRWNAKKDLSWVPLRPELVVEIKYDQLEGRRLRHTGQFLRWRPDREPLSCTYDQLDVPVRYDLAEVLETP